MRGSFGPGGRGSGSAPAARRRVGVAAAGADAGGALGAGMPRASPGMEGAASGPVGTR